MHRFDFSRLIIIGPFCFVKWLVIKTFKKLWNHVNSNSAVVKASDMVPEVCTGLLALFFFIIVEYLVIKTFNKLRKCEAIK